MSPLLKKTSFDASKCVSLLELTIKRIKILKGKRSIIAKQSRDDVAKLLQKGQDANAVARVEYAFREENIAEAYDLLEQYCQLIIKRMSAIKSQQECPSDAKEAIDSLIYAAPRCGDLQELQKLRDLVTIKYGSDYCAAVLELQPQCSVNQQIIEKLSSRPPSSDTRLKLLKEIAAEYKISWNYQAAVAASFKNEAASKLERPKASLSSSQVLKGAVSTDVEIVNPRYPDEKEPAQLAANNATFSKPKSTDLPEAHQAYVAQQSVVADVQKPTFDSLGHGEHEHHGRHKSHAAHGTGLSTMHSSSPKQKDFVSVSSKKSVVGSPTPFNKEKPHGIPLEQVSMESAAAPRDASLSTMRRPKDYVDASERSLHTVANKQNPHSMNVLQDELEGQQRNANPSENFDPHYEGRGFVSSSHMGSVDKVKSASVSMRQDGFLEKNDSVLPSTADMSRPEASVDPHVSVRKPSARKLVTKGPATSSQDFHEARAFSSKTSIRSVTNDEIDDDTAEALAARQYMSAHRSYIKADIGRGGEDDRNIEGSGFNLRTRHGSDTHRVDPYARARQEGKMDYKNISLTNEQVKEARRTPRAMYQEEEDTSVYGSNTHQEGSSVRPRQEGRIDHKNISPSYYQVEKLRASQVMDPEEEDASQRVRQDKTMGHKNTLPTYEQKQVKESRRTLRAMDSEEEDTRLRSDYNILHAYKEVKESRRNLRAMGQEEDDTNLFETHDREQPEATHHRRQSSSRSYADASFAREREWGSKNAFGFQEHHLEESSATNPSTLRELSKRRTTRRAAVDSEFERTFALVQAKMESADRAAEVAKAAIDMVRMSSMRSNANKKVEDKDSLREPYSRPSFKSSGGDVHTRTEVVVQDLDAIKDEHERKYAQSFTRLAEMRGNTDLQSAHHQERRMPHFDNSSGSESSEEEAHAKRRTYTAKKDGVAAAYHQGRLSASYGYVDDAVPRWANEDFDLDSPLQTRSRASQNGQYFPIVPKEAEGVTGKHYGVSHRSTRSSKLT